MVRKHPEAAVEVLCPTDCIDSPFEVSCKNRGRDTNLLPTRRIMGVVSSASAVRIRDRFFFGLEADVCTTAEIWDI